MKMIIPILIITAIFLSINTYVLTRAWQAIPMLGNWRWLLLLVPVFLSVCFYVGMASDTLPIKMVSFMQLAGGIWFFALLYFLALIICIDLIRLANLLFHFLPDQAHSYQNLKLYTLLAALVVASGAFVWGKIKFDHPSVVSLQIDKNKLADSLKIVMASDIHLGYTIGKKQLVQYVEMINAQKPDIVVICGDLIDRSMRPVEAANMLDELLKINSRYGIYAVLGNHEYYGDMPRITKFMKAAGITLLRDEVVEVAPQVYIIGRDDRTNKFRKPLDTLIAGIDTGAFKIVLDHQPFHLEEAEHAGIDIQLSGHVHNGQVWPGNLIAKNMYECSYGFYERQGTAYYISSGLGIWGPHLRIGTQSELVSININ